MRQFYSIYSKSKVELIVDDENTKSVISQYANSGNRLIPSKETLKQLIELKI